jgi:cytochrome P450
MTQNGKKFSEVMKTIHELPDAVIKERRKVPLPKDEKYLDFLDVLLAAYDESTGDRLTDAEIRDEVDTFMVRVSAAFSTSTNER